MDKWISGEFTPGDVVLVRWDNEGEQSYKIRPGLVTEVDGEICRVARGTSRHFCPSGRLFGEVALPMDEARKLGLHVATTFSLLNVRRTHVGQMKRIGSFTGSRFALSALLVAWKEVLRKDRASL